MGLPRKISALMKAAADAAAAAINEAGAENFPHSSFRLFAFLPAGQTGLKICLDKQLASV